MRALKQSVKKRSYCRNARMQLKPEIQKTNKEIAKTIEPQIAEQQAARDETDSALREQEL